MMMRLDKLLSHCNYGSRKEVKELIRKGYVSVNGEIIRNDDYKVQEKTDEIFVSDESVMYTQFVYIMMNKPENVVSATYDMRLKTVLDLLPEYQKQKIFPVGRLDIDTTGLLLLTNDGSLAHRLLSPKYHVDKRYLVTFSGTFKDTYVSCFANGIILDDGYKTLPSAIELLTENQAIVTIHEGKFHQIKRMFEALQLKVTKLRRISFGPLQLDPDLKEGKYRLLSQEEISQLKKEN